MSSVTFPTSVGGDGSTITDDANVSTGLANGGHKTRFIHALQQLVAVASYVVTKAAEAFASATNASASAVRAETSSDAAANSAVAAANSATQSAGFAGLAQSVTADTPMRLNQRIIGADFTLLGGYNGVSAGPIEIAENVTVTIDEGATWSIV